MIGFFLINVSAETPNPTPAPAQNNQSNEWSDAHTPTSGDSQSIGFYSSGCISGAKSLPVDGLGYQVMRTSRNRYYGHSNLLLFIQNFAKNLDSVGLSILLGDMGQPRGGPLPYGHASHQMGLDTDVWFWNHPEQRTRSLTQSERDDLPFVSMLDANGSVDPQKFNSIQITKLEFASADPQVQRIFVNPALKAYLCKSLSKTLQDKSWLHKLRPWPGHDEHFHVRLYCPSTSLDCMTQDAVPEGDGCAEAIEIASHPPIPEPVEPSTPLLTLPKKCEAVLRAN